MNALRCLVVDDEPLAVDVVVSYLQRLEIVPVCCENGVEAFQQLQKEPFDLLFLDIEMPGLNGIDLLKSLPHVAHQVVDMFKTNMNPHQWISVCRR